MGLNLHRLVSPAISVVNPPLLVSIQVSIGAQTNDDGTETPSYAAPVQTLAQVQPMSTKDLRQIDGLNLQGTHKVIYLSGNVQGAVRVTLKGGDLVTLPNGSIWKVTQPLEPWYDSAGWTKFLITLQNGS